MGFSNTPPGLFGLVKKAPNDGQCLANTVRLSLPFRRPADSIAAASADAHMIQQLVKCCERTIMKRNDRKSLPDRQTRIVSSIIGYPLSSAQDFVFNEDGFPVELHPGRSRPVSLSQTRKEWLQSRLRCFHAQRILNAAL